jgi:ankyrin repeat protein
MRNSSWLLIGLWVSQSVLAFDPERDTWLLPDPPPQAREAHPRYASSDFSRISRTANEREPEYAEGTQTELIQAAARNDVKQLEALLKSGVNPNAVVDEWGENALMHAVLFGNVDMTRLLLEAGANPNLKGRGFTPLGMAALLGRAQIARLLLKAGADVDRKSSDGNTPIIAASIMHRTEVVRALLLSHPDMSIWNREGRVSLGIAVQEGSKDIVAMMLEAGVDPNVMDRNSNRPLSWSDGQHDIALLLVSRGGSTF